MIITIGKYTIILFGIFILIAGFLMLFAPNNARRILRKAGSTNIINYTEISIRLLLGIVIILYSDFSKFPSVLFIFGWFMLITALILFFVPRKSHHNFSLKSADVIKPAYFRLISPFAFFLGGLIIYTAA